MSYLENLIPELIYKTDLCLIMFPKRNLDWKNLQNYYKVYQNK